MNDNGQKCIALLGASFSTGNLGVGALAESSIKCVLHRWPGATVVIIGAGRSLGEHHLVIDTNEIIIKSYPIRFCPNIFVRNHYVKIVLATQLLRIFPLSCFRRFFNSAKHTIGALCKADLVADITGGDSFSDIYGMKRFVKGYLAKRICQLTGKPFVMLPQTYGPFVRRETEYLAKRILNKTTCIASRDKDGVQVVEALIGKKDKVVLCPDVAFVLPVSHRIHDLLPVSE